MRYLALALTVAATATFADAVPVETGTLAGSVVTLHVLPSLKPNELQTLRLVLKNKQALAVFVPDSSGFAALAISPTEGFIQDGAPVASAVALSGFKSAAEAADAADKACDKQKAKASAACVPVLEIAPK